MNLSPYIAPAWPSDYAQRARGTDVAEMQAAMKLASAENLDYCEALERVRTPYGSQSAANPPPNLPIPAGCLPDPPASDDYMDADGNPLDYASLSRGW